MPESSIIKKYTDYIEAVKKEFPYLSNADIRRILKYGWRQIYIINVSGGDTLINSHKYKYWFYIGELTRNSIKHFRYYRKKMRTKVRMMYKRKNIQWDGYYYIAITDEEYEDFMASKNKRGRKKKYYIFENKFVYKILDECKLTFSGNKYFLKFKMPIDLGYFYKKGKLRCESPEIAFTRDRAAKFEDILVSNNNYEYL